jgi:hypothetical protein
MRRKIKALWRLLKSNDWILIVQKPNGARSFDVSMTDFEAQRMGMFMHNYFKETGEALETVNEILNSKR